MLNNIKQLVFKRILTISIAALLLSATVSLGFTPEPARAAAGCADGDRSFATSLANSGNFIDAGTINIVGGKVSLRYSSESGCAWGLISNLSVAAEINAMWGYIWIDRSKDGGKTWQGKLGEIKTNRTRSTHTGTYNTIAHDAIRACGNTVIIAESIINPRESTPFFNPVGCTPWFYPGRLAPEMSMGGNSFSSLSSPNNRYVLRMQGDGNLVLYSSGRPVWSINKFHGGGTIAKMQGDGNFVVIAPGNIPVWATGTNRSGSYLKVQNDGNVVAYHGGTPLWASNTVGR